MSYIKRWMEDKATEISDKYEVPYEAALTAVMDYGRDVMNKKMHVAKDLDEVKDTIVDIYAHNQELIEIIDEYDYYVVVYKDKEVAVA